LGWLNQTKLSPFHLFFICWQDAASASEFSLLSFGFVEDKQKNFFAYGTD
jgi:hypothetical protein